MERMWSPWRSEYIQSFKRPAKKGKQRTSLFSAARASKNDKESLVVWRGEHCFLIMNRYPYNSGHLMIVPNRQTSDVLDLTPPEMTEILQTLQRAIRALDTVMRPQGYNFGANFGRIAGAGLDDHIHFHVVPRWNGDTNFMPILADTKVISEDMKATWKKLRAVM